MHEHTRPSNAFAKRLTTTVVALLLVYGLLEAAVYVVYRPVVARPMDASADSLATPDMGPGRERAGLGFRDPSMTLHPYLGYVFLPSDERAEPAPAEIAISEDGFLDAHSAVRKRAEGRLVVGVTGGSVAGQLGTWHGALVTEAFRSRAEFQDVDLDFVWLGMPGYHQPQQTLQLSYILAQGGEFDVVINIDGFNEVAVPAVLNAPLGTHPLFPMNWSMVALEVPDARVRRSAGAVEYLTRERYARARRFENSFKSFSPTAKLLRQVDDRKLVSRITEFSLELRSVQADSIPWFVRGPERAYVEMDEMVPGCVDVWERCSRQMQALCEVNGIRYIHVLQPNQYDPGSKPLSRAEKDAAFESDGPYRPVVEAGYPLLRAAGQRLRDSGVAFHDLSMIFEDVEETLYVDACCHFNGEGNRIMVEAIVDAVRAAL